MRSPSIIVSLQGILVRDFPITSPIRYHLHHVGLLVVKQEAQMEQEYSWV